MKQRIFEIIAELKELELRIVGLKIELNNLSGDKVPDFNDVWGGAGPDCVLALA